MDSEVVIKRGDRGDHVARWQAWCLIQGADPKGIDGAFGSNSSVATAHVQRAMGVVEHGVVDRATVRAAVERGYVGDVPFVSAKHYTVAARTEVRWLVIHTMEAPEHTQTAERVARYFATMPDGRQASAHYSIDCDSIVQSVLERSVAWHAGGANRYGIGLEHAGYARQTPAEWADDYSTAMLGLSARLAALLCVRWSIPPVLVGADGLKAGHRGITTHKAVTDAFHAGKGHTDPGPHWPGAAYVQFVRRAMGHALASFQDDIPTEPERC